MPLAALEHPPAFRSVRNYRETFGDLAASVGEQLGMTPDAEQRSILDAIFAEDVAGAPAFFGVAVIAPRQNLKTSTLEIAALTDLFVFGVPLHVWTAHLFPTAKKTFEHMVGLIASNEDFRSRCRWPPRTANGDECIELLTGEKIEFRARSGGGGRGFTGNKVTLDEALYLDSTVMGALLPTMVTQRDAQVRYGSSAGIDRSEVLRGVRDRGRKGADRRLAYFEWCAPQRDCRDNCTHLPGTPGCVGDDLELLAAANPALGRRITVEALMQQRAELPPEEFFREFLGWWDDPALTSSVLPVDVWNALREDAPDGDPAAFGVDMTWDREWASIGWAVDGYVDIHEHRRGSGWVVQECVKLHKAYPSAPIVVHPKGPAAPLIEPLRDAGVRVQEIASDEYARACGGFFDAVTQQSVKHSDHPGLDAAVVGAQVSGGQSWVWDRKKGAVISPLVAVTLAHWSAVNGPSRYESRGFVTL